MRLLDRRGLFWCLLGAPVVAALVADPRPAAPYECRRAMGSITIDGQEQEPAWRDAVVIDSFAPHWEKRGARTKTVARLLWDEQYLYFLAELEDHDLYADVTAHDDMCWMNDVFELFFKPSPKQHGYYEFEVTPLNTKLDMYLPSRGSGGWKRWGGARQFGWQTAVTLQGKLNAADDDPTPSRGWKVEGRIPWTDFAPTGGRPQAGDVWKFTLCRFDYSRQHELPELSASAPLTQNDYHRYEDYAELLFK